MSEKPKVMHYRSTATPANQSDHSHVVQALVDRYGFGSETLSICECGRFMVPVELHNITPSTCPICKTERKLRWIYPRLPKKDLPEDALVVDTEKSAEWLQDVLDCWGQMRVASAQNAEVVEKLDRAIEKAKSGFGNLPSVVMDSIPTIVSPPNAWKKARDEAIQIAERSYLRESGFYATEPGGKILHELLYWLNDLTEERYQKYHHEPEEYPDYPVEASDSRMFGIVNAKTLFPMQSFVHNWFIEQMNLQHLAFKMETARHQVFRYCAQFQPIPSSQYYEETRMSDHADLIAIYQHPVYSPDAEITDVYLDTFKEWLMNWQESPDGFIQVRQRDGSTALLPINNGPFVLTDMDSKTYVPLIAKEIKILQQTVARFGKRYIHQWLKMAIECWEKQRVYLEKSKPSEEV